MKHFSATVNGETIEVSNVTMIPNEATNAKEYVVMITEPVGDEDFLTGEVVFEAKFEDQTAADLFYELLKEAEITEVG